ncbi:hypothetical protein ElyMa_001425900 [Elysia marginata]|uniref:Uncharacterized protein n=1 Tax=Elysia marginata TaxID=1093978 RepID=A0AAV4IYL1_9GAST|nr:hypothetical protein ElyMa_001425900 [Elysia marginata]
MSARVNSREQSDSRADDQKSCVYRPGVTSKRGSLRRFSPFWSKFIQSFASRLATWRQERISGRKKSPGGRMRTINKLAELGRAPSRCSALDKLSCGCDCLYRTGNCNSITKNVEDGKHLVKIPLKYLIKEHSNALFPLK